ncbi:MAG: hypothetical protein HC942_30860, partial [Microcoleus sp. SU_5_6]|nr:hypothetical protein [Microcoleus sp. SU_5_6]
FALELLALPLEVLRALGRLILVGSRTFELPAQIGGLPLEIRNLVVQVGLLALVAQVRVLESEVK